MALIRIDHNPSRRQLALFGGLWLAFFGAAGGVLLSRDAPWGVAVGVWVAAVGVPAVGAVLPEFLRWVYLGMAYLAFPIGFVVSYLLMGVVYFGLLTPMGLLMRLVGYDPMKRAFDRGAASYWVARAREDSATSYLRQF